MEDYQFREVISSAVLDLQRRMRELTELLADNIDFIGGMGDVTTAMAEVLTGVVETYAEAVRSALVQFRRTAEFFRGTVSGRYAHQNVAQEWAWAAVVDVLSGGDGEVASHVDDLIDVAFREHVAAGNPPPASLDYGERAGFDSALVDHLADRTSAPGHVRAAAHLVAASALTTQYGRPVSDYPGYRAHVGTLAQGWESLIKSGDG